MDIALSATTPGLDSRQLVDLAVQAESLGLGEVWLAEVGGPESMALAAAVATATSRVSIGIAVVAAGTRSPALLAMGAGSVSQLAAGRPVNLGIGSSSEVIMKQWHGASFAYPLARVRQAVEATRAALEGERDYDGDLAPMHGFRLASPPHGRVDLYVGALGPKMLQLAGAVGDGVCLNLMPPEMVPKQLDEVRRGAESAGRSLPDDFGVMARINWVPGDAAQGRDLIRHAFGAYYAQPVYNRFLAWSGYPDAADAIASSFREGDRAGVAAALSDEIIDGVALFGDGADARGRLEDFAAAGVSTAAVSILAPDHEATTAALGALAR